MRLMTASKSFLATMTALTLLVATPALAVINITTDEIWDGIQNPHAADGVILTTTGSILGDDLVATYTIPTGITIADGVRVFLHNISNPDTTMAVNWNFNPGAGPLTFAGLNSAIDTTKGGRNLTPKTFSLNMNDNSIGQSVPGAGRIYNGIYVDGNLIGDSLSVAINAVGTASVKIGQIDIARIDSQGKNISATTRGLIDIDLLRTSDVDSGGEGAGEVNLTGTALIIGDIDTRTFRTGSARGNGNINLRGLGQPANNVGDYNANTLAANSITLDGFITTNGPGLNDVEGNVTLNTVKATLASTFTYDPNPGTLFTVNVGDLTNGYTAGQMFVNNSGVTPSSVNNIVFHDGFAPPISVAWADNISGNWATEGNWTPGIPPNGANANVTIGSVITQPQTIFLNTGATVLGLKFDTTSSVAVAGVGGLTLEALSGNSSLSVLQGNHQIQTQVTLGSDTNASAASGTSVDLNGVLNLNMNTLNISGNGQVYINNLVTGMGSIVNGGVLGAGGSTGLAGNLSSTGTLTIDLAGAAANSFDAWNVTGTATLSGVLSVDTVSGFTPTAGQTFTVLTAASVGAVSLTLGGPDAALFTLIKNPTSLVLQAIGSHVAGDYNLDGAVNAADYTVWRDQLGKNVTSGTGADGDGNGVVNANDYSFWKTRFGNVSGSGSASQVGAVPEPSSVIIVVLAGLAMTLVGRRYC
jgi:hypothetical protein